MSVLIIEGNSSKQLKTFCSLPRTIEVSFGLSFHFFLTCCKWIYPMMLQNIDVAATISASQQNSLLNGINVFIGIRPKHHPLKKTNIRLLYHQRSVKIFIIYCKRFFPFVWWKLRLSSRIIFLTYIFGSVKKQEIKSSNIIKHKIQKFQFL